LYQSSTKRLKIAEKLVNLTGNKSKLVTLGLAYLIALRTQMM